MVTEPTKTVVELEKIVEVPTDRRKETVLEDSKEDEIVVSSVREEEELIKNPRFSEVKDANSRFLNAMEVGGVESILAQVERKESRAEMDSQSHEVMESKTQSQEVGEQAFIIKGDSMREI